VIPVIVPTTTEKRLVMVEATGPEFLYCALRTGITGTLTTLGEENLRFLDRAGKTGAKILAGFGIQTPEQVTALNPHVHGAVVGSALVRIIESATGPEDCYSKVVSFTRELTQA
jgi:tryptophan synthase alpha chain